MDKKPLVSVVVPCYNHEKYIEKCVLSILNQSYTNVELIVIDDGSSDRSFEVLQELKGKYQFILERQVNQGLSRTLNNAIKKYVRGQYLICLASDDYLHTLRIEKQVQFFELNPLAGLIFGKAYVIDGCENIISEIPINKIPECTFDTLFINNYIPALTVMVKTCVLNEVGLFDEESYVEDWDIYLRIANKYPFAFMDEYLAYYRKHGTNMSSNHSKMIIAGKYIVNKWKFHPLYKKAYDNIVMEELTILAITKKHKAIIMMIKQIRLINQLAFFKAFIKLFIKYKL
jgi:alpha-1,3-rhamnosyltransferase